METSRNLAWFFIDRHPEDAARLLERLGATEVAAILEEAPVRLTSRLLLKMAPATGAACLAGLDPHRAAEIVEELPPQVAASLLRALSMELRDRVLMSLRQETAQPLNSMLRFAEGTAGALMDTGALTLLRDNTAGQGRELVRRHARQALYYVYVVDDGRRLTGVVTMRELMLAAAGASIATIMSSDVASLPPDADRISILAHPGWRRFHALPVVDQRGAMLGVVRYETFRRLEEEAAASRRARGLQRTALELGEIYWLSIGRLIASLGATLTDGPYATNHEGADYDS